MNIGESNAWFSVLRALESDADSDTIERALNAARHLTEAANKTLGAGPRSEQVVGLLEQVVDVIAGYDDMTGGQVELTLRPVETVTTREELL